MSNHTSPNEISARSGPGDLPTMPDPTRNDPDGGTHLPTMPDPTEDPERGQEFPTDPDPKGKPPARIEDPPPSKNDGDSENEGNEKRWA